MGKDNVLYRLEKFSKGDEHTKNKLIEILIRQLTQQVEQLQKSLSNKDWQEINRLAHKMKSSFLLLKMERPIELTEMLRETAGMNIKITTQQLNELENICLKIISELKNIPQKI
jgi:HPt (histidine-containing phosphotransfer) domain-containing protein